MLTPEEIKTLIEKDVMSTLKQRASVGMKYYEGEHDILRYTLFYYDADGLKQIDDTRSNLKIPHPFFTELTDQLSGYMLSTDDTIVKSDNPELQAELDEYFGEEFNSALSEQISGAYVKGFDYIHAYKNADDRLTFEYTDGMGIVEVRTQDTDRNLAAVIYHYPDTNLEDKLIRRIQVHTDAEIYYYVQDSQGEVVPDESYPVNPIPNVIYSDKSGKLYGSQLGFVPFWRLDNNRKQFSGLKPIKALIDDYDLMECGLSNNLQDFDYPIYAISGYDGDNLDELMQNIKTKKVVGIDADGGIDAKTIDIPYEARKIKADEDEKNIYRFGMGVNVNGLKDTSATTNIAIKMAFSLLDLKARKLTIRVKKMLREIIQVVLDDINRRNGTDYRQKDVYMEFNYVLPVNTQEKAQNSLTEAQAKQTDIGTVLQIASYIGDEETLKLICESLDLDFNELKKQIPERQEVKNLLNAQNDLEMVDVE